MLQVKGFMLQVTGFMLQVPCVNFNVLRFRNIDVLNALKHETCNFFPLP